MADRARRSGIQEDYGVRLPLWLIHGERSQLKMVQAHGKDAPPPPPPNGASAVQIQGILERLLYISNLSLNA